MFAADQEGGTLLALAGTTLFPGNLALGATRSARAGAPHRARRWAASWPPWASTSIMRRCATSRQNPSNPVVGTALVSARTRAGGRAERRDGGRACRRRRGGHAQALPRPWRHRRRLRILARPVLAMTRGRFATCTCGPFKAAVSAGARLMMTAHVALPPAGRRAGAARHAVARADPRPAARRSGLSRASSSATRINMKAIGQGAALVIDAIAAAAAGVDLLLLQSNSAEQRHRLRRTAAGRPPRAALGGRKSGLRRARAGAQTLAGPSHSPRWMWSPAPSINSWRGPWPRRRSPWCATTPMPAAAPAQRGAHRRPGASPGRPDPRRYVVLHPSRPGALPCAAITPMWTNS